MLKTILPNHQELYSEFFNLGLGLASNENLIERDNQSITDVKHWEILLSKQLHLLVLPKQFGGHGYSALETAVAVMGFGKSSKDNGLNFSFLTHIYAGLLPLLKFGGKNVIDLVIKNLNDSAFKLSCAITELHSGSDVFNMKMNAVKDALSYKLNGEKYFITNAPIASHFITYCFTDSSKGSYGGLSAFLVEKNTTGFSVDAKDIKMGLKTCPSAKIKFKDVVISESLLISKEGQAAAIFNDVMIWERMIFTALNIGLLERVYETVLKHLKSTERNHQRLISFPNVYELMAEFQVFIEASKALLYNAAFAIDNEHKQAFVKTAQAKAFLSDGGQILFQKILNLCGSYGYLSVNELEREYRDFLAYTIYSGNSHTQKKIISSTF